MRLDASRCHKNGAYMERPGAQDGYENKVPRNKAEIDELRRRIAVDLERAKFRCDELPRVSK